MTLCELCLADSGRMNARLRCCKVRFISKLPKAHRQALYETVRMDEGEGAMQVLIKEVSAEHQRRNNQKGKVNG